MIASYLPRLSVCLSVCEGSGGAPEVRRAAGDAAANFKNLAGVGGGRACADSGRRRRAASTTLIKLHWRRQKRFHVFHLKAYFNWASTSGSVLLLFVFDCPRCGSMNSVCYRLCGLWQHRCVYLEQVDTRWVGSHVPDLTANIAEANFFFFLFRYYSVIIILEDATIWLQETKYLSRQRTTFTIGPGEGASLDFFQCVLFMFYVSDHFTYFNSHRKITTWKPTHFFLQRW